MSSTDTELVADSRSNKFQNGDVTFRSSDRVLFKVHRLNLEVVSQVFPATKLTSSNEIANLEEDSTTLDILFSFLYPDRIPNLTPLSFEKIVDVANAANKYGMDAAMIICHLHLQEFASKYPVTILKLAGQHDSDRLIAAVAPYLLSLTPTEVQSMGVPSKYCVKWVSMYIANLKNLVSLISSICE
ncbi:hypothetical protein GYMLUDRAFT_404898 [Collybiopsis luxurians FD-317 M1]|uniref:BTB domain-containing protein n=1 Tax=Collybiopsis luxurians FD-317 M1 TaxID=944289 RepID=A0A0D0BA75_9AGAR|nr:hypothetical protein GYMLUDRAFT_404898 [Collybiopsis luxurians FD-317 M1]